MICNTLQSCLGTASYGEARDQHCVRHIDLEGKHVDSYVAVPVASSDGST